MKDIVESIAIFGSVARSMTDAASDKDVLIVASDKDRRDELAASWKSQGWSVAPFAPGHLSSMVRSGSLFIQHLRSEALIVGDNGNWLGHLLANSKPKADYSAEFAESEALFYPLQYLGNSEDERHFAADVAYVYLRNAAILLNANDGVYRFSYGDLVRDLASRFEFDDMTVQLLVRLRELKAAYRSRRFIANSEPSAVWHQLCARVAQQVGTGARSLSDRSNYAYLRDVERQLLQRWSITSLDGGNAPPGACKAWKIVTAPRDYRWVVRNRGIMARLIDGLNETEGRPAYTGIVACRHHETTAD